MTIEHLHIVFSEQIVTSLPKAKHSAWKSLAEEIIWQGHNWQMNRCGVYFLFIL